MSESGAPCISCTDGAVAELQEDPRLTATWKKTIRVAVSGAAGQISNHLLFMVRTATAFRLFRASTTTATSFTGCFVLRY